MSYDGNGNGGKRAFTRERGSSFDRGSTPDPLLKNVPPHSAEAERAVLGAILIDSRAIDSVAQILSKPEDFYLSSHAVIYEVLLELWTKDQPVDVVLLNEELEKKGALERVGGTGALAELTDVVPTAANAEYYANIVRDRAIQRRLIEVAAEIQKDAFETTGAVDTMLDRAEQGMFEVTQRRLKNEATVVGDVVKVAYEELLAREQGAVASGLPSYFADLDEVTSGFLPGELTILAARPSMGKCLGAASEILLADGSLATIEEIVRRREARLLTLDAEHRLSLTSPSAFVDDGIKPAFRVRTRSGREVVSTITHPFLGQEGWKRLGELRVGDPIAVPAVLPVFGTAPVSSDQLALLAAQTAMPRAQEVPSQVFTLPRPQLATFLAHLFGTEGWLERTNDTEPHTAVVLELSAPRTTGQVQHLLLRFGVVSDLTAEGLGCRLTISDGASCARFLAEVGLVGQEERVRAAQAQLAAAPTRRLAEVPVGAGLEHPWLRAPWEPPSAQARASDIAWDPIVAIEPLGPQQVYDLTIPDTHNFVANDICVHNTSFALNVIRNIVLHGGSAAFFSIEMPKLQVTTNMLCAIAKLDGHRLRGGFLTKEEKRNFMNACDVLEPAQFFIDDSPTLSTMELRAKGRRLRAQHGIEMIMIDYLQLMTGSSKSAKESRQIEVSEISRNVKALARELEIPIVCLAQLSRKVEERKDKMPMMSDLRESGSIEQDADKIILLHRPEYYEPEKEEFKGIANIIVAKNRNGPTGRVEMAFVKNQMRFETSTRM